MLMCHIVCKPHAKLNTNYMKIAPSVIYHLIIDLFKISSCFHEGSAYMELSASV